MKRLFLAGLFSAGVVIGYGHALKSVAHHGQSWKANSCHHQGDWRDQARPSTAPSEGTVGNPGTAH